MVAAKTLLVQLLALMPPMRWKQWTRHRTKKLSPPSQRLLAEEMWEQAQGVLLLQALLLMALKHFLHQLLQTMMMSVSPPPPQWALPLSVRDRS